MTTGYVLFRLGESTFAAPLDEVREIVRYDGVEPLPGAEPPLAGILVLRGTPIPVMDVRAALGSAPSDEAGGDVLVMALDGDTVGVAVDQVVAVLAPDALDEAAAPARSLPSYVVAVRRHAGNPVLLVDLQRMLDRSAGLVGPTA